MRLLKYTQPTMDKPAIRVHPNLIQADFWGRSNRLERVYISMDEDGSMILILDTESDGFLSVKRK